MATKIKLRRKTITGNRQSLYLDFYYSRTKKGEDTDRGREFLGMYVFIDKSEINKEIKKLKKLRKDTKQLETLCESLKPLNNAEKLHNESTLELAEQIRRKRENDLNKPEIYTGYEKEQLKIKEQGEKSFVQYFKSLADKRMDSNHDNWISSYKYFETFTSGSFKFDELNEKVCNDFKEYLLTVKSNKSSKVILAQNSAVSYYNKFKAALKQAYKEGYLKNDLNSQIGTIKQAETQRNFLTMEELNSLVHTDCQNRLMKRSALFSALTGLRFSDIEKLVWGELEYIEGNGYFIQFKQKKTKGVEMMPISEQAYSLLGERKEPNDKVFEGLNYSAYSNKHLYQWIGAAGITKDITFHCFRHTFATLQLSKGTDIYTVSKMLGHRELKTTQIYAKIIDQTKRVAADKIKLNF
jgi:integrase